MLRFLRWRLSIGCAVLLLVNLFVFLPAQLRGQTVTIVAVGDISLAHGVERVMDEKGRGYPLASLKPFLRSSDIVFGNLECCLATGGAKVAKKYNFRGHPRGARALREAGFSIVSLANNHSLDFGKPALAETLRHLHRQGVMSAGAGHTLQDSTR